MILPLGAEIIRRIRRSGFTPRAVPEHVIILPLGAEIITCAKKWSRGDSNPRAVTATRSHLRAYLQFLSQTSHSPAAGAMKSQVDNFLTSQRSASPLKPARYFRSFTPSGVEWGSSQPIRLRGTTACLQVLFCILLTCPACSTARSGRTVMSGRFQSAPQMRKKYKV